MFNIADTASGAVDLNLLFSDRYTPLKTFVTITEKLPSIIQKQYSLASVNTFAPPIMQIKGFINMIITRGMIILTITLNISPCTLLFPASLNFFAPINLATEEFTPAVNPTPTPIVIMNKGVTIPMAARAFAPNPLTHIASAILFTIVKSRDIIIGMLNPMMLLFG